MHSYRILKRSQYMKHQPKGIGRISFGHGRAYRGHETGALAIGDHFLIRAFFAPLGCWRLSFCGLCHSRGQTGHRGATFQESPAIRLFRIHGFLLLG